MSTSFVSVILIKLRRTNMSKMPALDISGVKPSYVAVLLLITAVTSVQFVIASDAESTSKPKVSNKVTEAKHEELISQSIKGAAKANAPKTVVGKTIQRMKRDEYNKQLGLPTSKDRRPTVGSVLDTHAENQRKQEEIQEKIVSALGKLSAEDLAKLQNLMVQMKAQEAEEKQMQREKHLERSVQDEQRQREIIDEMLSKMRSKQTAAKND